MLDLRKYVFALCGVMCCWGAMSADLAGTAAVNVTSTTASAAKNIAMDEARRQIIRDALGNYSDRGQLAAAIKGADASALAALIAATGIDGEQLSDTTYSANITMTLDAAAAKQWMGENNVHNWLGDGAAAVDNFIVRVTLSDPMADWISLNRAARGANIDFGAKTISGATATVELPTSKRGAFTAAVSGAGWKYSDVDGVLNIWR